KDAGLAWGPRNRAFQTVDELQQVLGVTRTVYAQVAPDLTVYSVNSKLPALADQRMTEILRRAGFTPALGAGAPGTIFSIRSEAKSAGGAEFIREAIVEPYLLQPAPRILFWSQGVSTASN